MQDMGTSRLLQIARNKTDRFIKAVAAILGVFAVPGKNDSNSIEFVSVDTIKENETRAYDWTKRLLLLIRRINLICWNIG